MQFILFRLQQSRNDIENDSILDQSVFLQKTLTLTYIRFHSIHFLLLIFPFLT